MMRMSLWLGLVLTGCATAPALEGPVHRAAPATPAAPRPAAQEAPSATTEPCGAGMVALTGGRLTLGLEPHHAVGPAPIEVPTRSVDVAPFCIDRTEVTVAAYQACVEAGACSSTELTSPLCNEPGSDRDDHPINCVTWAQANNYCAYRNARLPTEAEWEMAARGVAGRLHPWGDATSRGEGGIFDGYPQATQPVGTRPAADTPEGVADLAGNVWEWTSSELCMHDDADCLPTQAPPTANVRALKGSINDSLVHRGSNRFNASPLRANRDTGFRCAGPGVAGKASEDSRESFDDVHWSTAPADSPPTAASLPPGVAFPPDLTLKRAGRVICMVDVRVDRTGTPLRVVRAAAPASPARFESGCTAPFATIAVEAANAARWERRHHGFKSTVPVFIDRNADQCPRCLTVTVSPQ